jgi:hypothetical protein
MWPSLATADLSHPWLWMAADGEGFAIAPSMALLTSTHPWVRDGRGRLHDVKRSDMWWPFLAAADLNMVKKTLEFLKKRVYWLL